MYVKCTITIHQIYIRYTLNINLMNVININVFRMYMKCKMANIKCTLSLGNVLQILYQRHEQGFHDNVYNLCIVTARLYQQIPRKTDAFFNTVLSQTSESSPHPSPRTLPTHKYGQVWRCGGEGAAFGNVAQCCIRKALLFLWGLLMQPCSQLA